MKRLNQLMVFISTVCLTNPVLAAPRGLIVGKASPNDFIETFSLPTGFRAFQLCSTTGTMNEAKCKPIGKADGYSEQALKDRVAKIVSNQTNTKWTIFGAAALGLSLGLVGYLRLAPETAWVSFRQNVLVEGIQLGGRGLGVGAVGAGASAIAASFFVNQQGWFDWTFASVELGEKLVETKPLVMIVDDLPAQVSALNYVLMGL